VDGWGAPATERALHPPPRVQLLDVPRYATLARTSSVSSSLRYRVRGDGAEEVVVDVHYWAGGGPWRRATTAAPTLESSADGEAVFRAEWDVAADLGQASAVQLRLVPRWMPSVAGSIAVTPRTVLSAPLLVGCRGGCCDASGAPREAGVVCRRRRGPCDVEEVCDGSSVVCPPDGRAEAGEVCRAAAGACDVEETCDGSSVSCPADASAADGTTCGADQCAPMACQAGVCVDGAPVDCDDGDVCTADACAPETGCSHEPIAGCCHADSECTGGPGGACVEGGCVYDDPPADDGGCGCAAPGRAAPHPTWLWLGLALGALWLRRPRRTRS
jgi:MYXO-CTERM domain-containing protein